MDLKKLLEPFDPAVVHWRVGSTTKDKSKGMALAYIDARAVMDRLDEVCGPENWSDRYYFEGVRTMCEISIRCEETKDGRTGFTWVSKSDGAGDSDIEGEKGAISDAFKRAAVKWGIGRYLYSVDSRWVEIENGKYLSKNTLAKLAKSLATGTPTGAAQSEAAPPPEPPPEAAVLVKRGDPDAHVDTAPTFDSDEPAPDLPPEGMMGGKLYAAVSGCPGWGGLKSDELRERVHAVLAAQPEGYASANEVPIGAAANRVIAACREAAKGAA